MAQYSGSAYARQFPDQYSSQYIQDQHAGYPTPGAEGVPASSSQSSFLYVPGADLGQYATGAGLAVHPGLVNVPDEGQFIPQRIVPPAPPSAQFAGWPAQPVSRHDSAPPTQQEVLRYQLARQEAAMASSASLPVERPLHAQAPPDARYAAMAPQHGRSQSIDAYAMSQQYHHPLRGATLSYDDSPSPSEGIPPATPPKPKPQERGERLPTSLSNMSLASSVRSAGEIPASPKSGPGTGTDSPSRHRTRDGSRSSLKSMIGGLVHSMSDVFAPNEKRPEISTPYDPVHLTHVGFNAHTGEFTGLPREWQQLLQQSGISRQELEQHPQAVMDIVAFYQDNAQDAPIGGENDDVWTKFGANVGDDSSSSQPHEQEVWDATAQYAHPAPVAPAPPPVPLGPAVPAPGRVSPSFRPPELLQSSKSSATQPLVEDVTHTYNPAAERPPDAAPAASATQLVRNQSQRAEAAAAAAAARPAEPEMRPPLGAGHAVPRRQTKRNKVSDAQVMTRLQAVCMPGNPTKMFKDLVKIGQGASGGVFTAKSIGSEQLVAIKQMVLSQQPKKDLIVNEIEVMKQSRHPNIVNFLNAFLNQGELWVVMEYMEGGPLTDVVLHSILSEGQIAAVAKECLTGLHHLHTHGVIHRDIKSDNVLMSMNGNIKLSTSLY